MVDVETWPIEIPPIRIYILVLIFVAASLVSFKATRCHLSLYSLFNQILGPSDYVISWSSYLLANVVLLFGSIDGMHVSNLKEMELHS